MNQVEHLVGSISENLPISLRVTLRFLLAVTFVFQNATQNSLELIDDPKAVAVDEIAAKLGLYKVGLFEFVSAMYSI